MEDRMTKYPDTTNPTPINRRQALAGAGAAGVLALSVMVHISMGLGVEAEEIGRVASQWLPRRAYRYPRPNNPSRPFYSGPMAPFCSGLDTHSPLISKIDTTRGSFPD